MPIASAFRLLARRPGNQKRFWRDSVKRAGRLRQRHGLMVKGKRISCPPPQHLLIRVALPVQEYDYEHWFSMLEPASSRRTSKRGRRWTVRVGEVKSIPGVSLSLSVLLSVLLTK